jgi:short-subunit dehydrogenase
MAARTGEPKVVLITGASSGLGAEMARVAARKGYHLVLTARRSDRLDALAGEIQGLGTGSEAVAIAASLDDPATPERLVSETLARFGRLDVLINNAGMGLPTLFTDADPDALRRQLELNFVAPLMLARHAIPALIERKGTIINVGSAITCVPNPALGAYGATKSGLAYWNDALRRELWDRGITVCLVEPGPVQTEFFTALTGLADRPGGYHPMLDAPYPWMTARVEVVARRIVGLIERPKRRLSVLRRFVWPWRLIGFVLRFSPPLADLGVVSVARFYEKNGPRREVEATPARRE